MWCTIFFGLPLSYRKKVEKHFWVCGKKGRQSYFGKISFATKFLLFSRNSRHFSGLRSRPDHYPQHYSLALASIFYHISSFLTRIISLIVPKCVTNDNLFCHFFILSEMCFYLITLVKLLLKKRKKLDWKMDKEIISCNTDGKCLLI